LCDEISVLLKDLKDPYDNSSIIENVYRWNEIYSKNAFNPPDLVFDLKKGITAAEYLRFPDKLFEVFQSKKNHTPFIFSEDSVGRSGDHSQYGIFFAYGRGIKTDYKIDNISVQDVLPTIFSAIGISIPNTIDGISKIDIFIKKPIVKNIDWKSYQSAKQMLKKSELDKINELREKRT
jgi:predicted AlkP superfamily phosphohydrolase/phosphomutase